jgi:hypothetical protein
MRKPSPHFIAVLIIYIVVASIGVVIFRGAAASGMSFNVETPIVREPLRPAHCARYYNDGTHRWKRCMGVEYK